MVTLKRQPRLEDFGRACRPHGGMWALAENSRHWGRWRGHGWILDPERVLSLQLEDGMGKVGSRALQRGGGHTARRPAGPPWTLMWFVPCTEHLTKGTRGAGTHPLHPGLELWALPTQRRHPFPIPTKALYGTMVDPRPGNVTDVGLNPSLSS